VFDLNLLCAKTQLLRDVEEGEVSVTVRDLEHLREYTEVGEYGLEGRGALVYGQDFWDDFELAFDAWIKKGMPVI